MVCPDAYQYLVWYTEATVHNWSVTTTPKNHMMYHSWDIRLKSHNSSQSPQNLLYPVDTQTVERSRVTESLSKFAHLGCKGLASDGVLRAIAALAAPVEVELLESVGVGKRASLDHCHGNIEKPY